MENIREQKHQEKFSLYKNRSDAKIADLMNTGYFKMNMVEQ